MTWLMMGLVMLGGMLGFHGIIMAQPSVRYATGRLCWTWTKQPPDFDAPADRLNVRCGTTPGSREFPAVPIDIPLQDPPLEYCEHLRNLFPAPETYPAPRYCAATAALGVHESAESVEISVLVTEVESVPPGELPPPADITKPVVAIAQPKPKDVVVRGSTVPIVVTAGDDSGVVREVLVHANKELVCEMPMPPYHCEWRVPKRDRKAYTLQAQATDGAGNTALSPRVQVQVQGESTARTPTSPKAKRPDGKPEW